MEGEESNVNKNLESQSTGLSNKFNAQREMLEQHLQKIQQQKKEEEINNLRAKRERTIQFIKANQTQNVNPLRNIVPVAKRNQLTSQSVGNTSVSTESQLPETSFSVNNIYQGPEENNPSIFGSLLSGINPAMVNVSTNSSMPFTNLTPDEIEKYDENWKKITDHLSGNESTGIMKSIELLNGNLESKNTGNFKFYNSMKLKLEGLIESVDDIFYKIIDIFNLLNNLNKQLGGPGETTENATKIQLLLTIINTYITNFGKIESLYKSLLDTDTRGQSEINTLQSKLKTDIEKLSGLFTSYFKTIGIFDLGSDSNNPQLYTYNQIMIAAKKSSNNTLKEQFKNIYAPGIYLETKNYIDANKQMIIKALNDAGIPNWDGYGKHPARPVIGGRNKTKKNKKLKVKRRSKRKHRLSKRTQVYKRKQRFSKRGKPSAFLSRKA